MTSRVLVRKTIIAHVTYPEQSCT